MSRASLARGIDNSPAKKRKPSAVNPRHKKVVDAVMEGGALDHDGFGTVLTTAQCLLNPNRNIDWVERDAEACMARALGVRFLDAAGRDLPEGGAALARLARVDLSGLDPRLAESTLLVACDVDNPLCGPRGASAVYGPQKGATPDLVAELDTALAVFATIAAQATGRDIAHSPGAGAAGGLGAGLPFFTPASLRPGVAIVLETTGFEALVQGADLVLTGCTLVLH